MIIKSYIVLPINVPMIQLTNFMKIYSKIPETPTKKQTDFTFLQCIGTRVLFYVIMCRRGNVDSVKSTFLLRHIIPFLTDSESKIHVCAPAEKTENLRVINFLNGGLIMLSVQERLTGQLNGTTTKIRSLRKSLAHLPNSTNFSTRILTSYFLV